MGLADDCLRLEAHFDAAPPGIYLNVDCMWCVGGFVAQTSKICPQCHGCGLNHQVGFWREVESEFMDVVSRDRYADWSPGHAPLHGDG